MSEQNLVRLNDELNKTHEFSPGEIVEWKPGLKNRNSNGPFIVNRVLDESIVDKEGDSGSSCFMEPLDIILGHIGSGGEYALHYFDSRRFQHFAGYSNAEGMTV